MSYFVSVLTLFQGSPEMVDLRCPPFPRKITFLSRLNFFCRGSKFLSWGLKFSRGSRFFLVGFLWVRIYFLQVKIFSHGWITSVRFFWFIFCQSSRYKHNNGINITMKLIDLSYNIQMLETCFNVTLATFLQFLRLQTLI